MSTIEKKQYINITYDYLKENQKIKGRVLREFENIEYYIYEDVFSPEIFEDTFFFAKSLPLLDSPKVLEVGAGTGLISLYLAKNGASHVTSTDINPRSIDNISKNIEINKLETVIQVIHSDVFDKLNSKMKYDLIFWNVPFIYKATKNSNFLEDSVFDYKYKSLEKFIYNCRYYLSSQGRIFIGFSKISGHFSELVRLANNAFMSVKEVNSYKYPDGFSIELYELVSFQSLRVSNERRKKL